MVHNEDITMGSGYFFVGYDYLRQVLHMPDDAVITCTLGDDENERVMVSVWSPDVEGEQVELCPLIEAEPPLYHPIVISWGEQIAQDRPKG
jgi:hypothetical protein